MQRPILVRVEEKEAEPYCCEYDDVCNKQATHYRVLNSQKQWLCHHHVTELRNQWVKTQA